MTLQELLEAIEEDLESAITHEGELTLAEINEADGIITTILEVVKSDLETEAEERHESKK